MLRKATYANCVINTSAAVNEEGKIIGGNMTETALSAYMEGYKTDLGVTRTHFVPFNLSLIHICSSWGRAINW